MVCWFFVEEYFGLLYPHSFIAWILPKFAAKCIILQKSCYQTLDFLCPISSFVIGTIKNFDTLIDISAQHIHGRGCIYSSDYDGWWQLNAWTYDEKFDQCVHDHKYLGVSKQ